MANQENTHYMKNMLCREIGEVRTTVEQGNMVCD